MVSCALLYNFTGKKADYRQKSRNDKNGLHDDEHPF